MMKELERLRDNIISYKVKELLEKRIKKKVESNPKVRELLKNKKTFKNDLERIEKQLEELDYNEYYGSYHSKVMNPLEQKERELEEKYLLAKNRNEAKHQLLKEYAQFLKQYKREGKNGK